MRKFYNHEDGKTYTEDELLREYCEYVSTREDSYYLRTSFNKWLEDCTSKNGSLTELHGLDTLDKYLIKSAAEKLWDSFKDFHEIMERVNEGSFNDCLSEGYPFSDSFDAMRFVMGEWIDRLNASLDDLYR